MTDLRDIWRNGRAVKTPCPTCQGTGLTGHTNVDTNDKGRAVVVRRDGWCADCGGSGLVSTEDTAS